MAGRSEKNAGYIRHLAFQIIAQLPDDTAEAISVLDYAKRVLNHPIAVEPPEPPVPLRVLKRGGD